jgi:serine/threonine-protein kinase
VLHQIGAGRLGPVFRAWQGDRDRLVAIKLFQLDLVPEQVDALVAELETLVGLRLAHGAIAAPVGAGMQAGAAYLAQELCTGESLDVVMRQGGAWAPARAVTLLRRIASAIDIAAARGAHHGALHPRDVLLAAADVRVTGFGVSQALERAGLRVLGRHPYGAPELADGSCAGSPADVYALAVLAYELLAGKRVSGIADQNIEQLAQAQKVDRPALRQVFATALAADPGARYQTARAFVTALDGALSVGGPRLPGLDGDEEAEVAPVENDVDHDHEPASSAVVTFPVSVADLPLRDEPADESPIIDLPEPPDSVQPSPEPMSELSESLDLDTAPEPAPESVVAAEPETVVRPMPEPRAATVFADRAAESVPHSIAYAATWPLVLALGVGLLVGFALGYGTGARDMAGTGSLAQVRTGPPPTSAAVIAQPPASAAVATAASGVVEHDLPPSSAPNDAGQAAPAVISSRASQPVGAPAAPVDGRLVVRTTPEGAHVVINGRDRGVTPLSLSGLPFATYRLRLELAGYQADERRVALNASGATRTLEASLRPVPQPPTGIVVVESRPSGAKVFIDEKLLGVTPLTVPAMAAGEHHLRLALPNFQPWIATVQVTGGEHNRVTASLEEGPPNK